jgi:hypothetical protein
MARNITVSVQVVGSQACLRALQRADPVATQALNQALYMEAEKIMAASKLLVPVDTGVLRNSGHVQWKGTARSKNFEVFVGYGGPSIPYAIVQHERMDYKHTVGEAKYLEKPAMKAAEGMGRRVGRHVDRELQVLRVGRS